MKRKIFAILITLGMIMLLLPVLPENVLAAGTELGDFTVDSLESCVLEDNVLTISTAGAYKIRGSSETQRIVVTGASTDVFNITMDSLTISSDICAFEIKGGATVNITLTASTINTLTSGSIYSGLQKNSTSGTLTISGSGELIATGGENGGAGIGGGHAVAATGVEISTTNGTDGMGIVLAGGRITATGKGGGAGIGGSGGLGSTGDSGMQGGAGGVIITGGIISATGGTDGGAGIGGGAGSEGIMGGDGGIGTVAVSGGMVTASSANGIGLGSGFTVGAIAIGSGIDVGADNSTITITGGSIKATMGSRPKSGTSDVYKTVLQFPFANTAVVDLQLATLVSGCNFVYGCNDMATDENKLIYVWLPSTNSTVKNNNVTGIQNKSQFGASIIIMNDSDTIYVFPINYDISWYVGHSSPYTISTEHQLRGFSEIVAGTAYVEDDTKISVDNFQGDTVILANDITLSSILFKPIGTKDSPFKGVFDGQMYTVSNLTVSSAECAGLFGHIYGYDSTVKNVGVSGSVSGVGRECKAGGIVGWNEGLGYVINCFNTAAVSNRGGEYHTGGVVGKNYGYVYNCYNTGKVSGEEDEIDATCGGVIGFSDDGYVYNCYNIGEVMGAHFVGGAIGRYEEGRVQNCYWKSDTANQGCASFETDGSNFVDCVAFTSENGGTLVSSIDGTTSLLTALNAYVEANQTSFDGGLYRWAAGTGTYAYPVFAEEVGTNITTASLPDATLGSSYSKTLIASGATPSYWCVTDGTLPAGLSLSEGGVISGTPSSSGNYSFTVQVENTSGSDMQELSITVNVESNPIDTSPQNENIESTNATLDSIESFKLKVTDVIPPQITTTELADAILGSTYSKTLSATGTSPIAWSIESGSLPPGLNLSKEGIISGKPSLFGTYSFTIKAQNVAGSDRHTWTLVIPLYANRTLNDSTSGIIVSGVGINQNAVLTVSELSLQDIGASDASDAIRARMSNNAWVLIFGGNISMSTDFTGRVTVTMPVGEKYNGKTITILHDADGTLQTYTAVAVDGNIAFNVSSLSPFAAFARTELTMTSSVMSDDTIKVGRSITLMPNVDGGEWDWDATYFSATSDSPATFTALKAGASTITYTVEGVSITYDTTIEQNTLSEIWQNFTWVWLLAAIVVLALAGIYFWKMIKKKENIDNEKNSF